MRPTAAGQELAAHVRVRTSALWSESAIAVPPTSRHTNMVLGSNSRRHAGARGFPSGSIESLLYLLVALSFGVNRALSRDFDDSYLVPPGRELDNLEPILLERLQDIDERFEGHRFHDVAVHAEIVALVNVFIGL